MRCAFPACNHDSSQNSPRVSFHRVPDEESLRAAWMEALGQTDWTPEPGSVVCSEHVLMKDVLGTSTEHPQVINMDLIKSELLNHGQISPASADHSIEEHFEFDTEDLDDVKQTDARVDESPEEVKFTVDQNHIYAEDGTIHVAIDEFKTENEDLNNIGESHIGDIDDFDNVNKQTDARVDESPEDVKFTVDQNHIYGEDGTIHVAIELKTENEGFNNIRESYSGDIDDFDNVNKQTDARVDESPEDVKFKVDQNHIYGEDGTIHVVINESKTENEGLNNIKESHLEDIVCDTIIGNSYINNLNVKIENSEVNDKNSYGDEQTARHMASTGEDVLDDLTQLEGLGAKTMKKTRRVVNGVEADEQQTPEADGPSTDDMLRGDICHYQTDSDIQLLEHLKVHAASKKRFHCDNMCDYKCHCKDKLICHLRTHSDGNEYVCKVCKNKYSSKKAVTLHMRIHFKRKVHSCDVCNKMFQHNRSLKKHQLIHSNEKPYSCNVCSKKFRQNSTLIKHLLIHSNLKSYTCDVCNKMFRDKGHLNSHLLIHSNEKPHSCDVCKKMFREKGHLNRHVLIHSNLKPYSCDVCNKKFGDNISLKKHQVIHSNLKPYSCEVCNKRFSAKSKLKNHQLIHSNEKPYSCDVCNKMFKDKGTLKKHLLIHSTEKPYLCDVCNNRFSAKMKLKNHQLIHSNEKPFSCDGCNKTFKEKSTLKKHLLIHSNEKPYSCDVCNKMFRHNSSLKKHQLIHSNLKPYSCNVCNKMFRAKGHLNRHLLIHSNEKPYSCNICNKIFRQKGHLNRHLLMHTNEKPYSCDICCKMFREKGHLNRHLLIHSNEKPR